MTSHADEIAKTLALCKADPVLFCRHVCKIEPDPWQIDFLNAVRDNAFVAVKSGNGVGKTTAVAVEVLWFTVIHYPCKVVIYGPQQDQARAGIWNDIALIIERMDPLFREQFIQQSDKLMIKGHEASQWAMFRTANSEKPESLQGTYSQNMLLIYEEASGLSDAAFEFTAGALRKDTKMVLIGNPTKNEGYFFNIWDNNQDHFVKMTVSLLDETKFSPARYQEGLKFEKIIRSTYGVHSSAYSVKVLGEFPLDSTDGVIPRQDVLDAVNRDVAPSGARIWGVDVAYAGKDRSILCRRHGNTLCDYKAWHGLDPVQLAYRIHEEWKTAKPENRPVEICVDGIGLGAGTVGALREMGLPVKDVKVSNSAINRDRYGSLRDELWFKCREWFENNNCRIPDDHELIRELTLPSYYTDVNGKLRVESKDQMRKKGRRSPDIADALCLTFASHRQLNWTGSSGTKQKRNYEWIV